MEIEVVLSNIEDKTDEELLKIIKDNTTPSKYWVVHTPSIKSSIELGTGGFYGKQEM